MIRPRAFIGVPCVECKSIVIANVSSNGCNEFDKFSLVKPNRALPSNGLVAICSCCLLRFALRKNVAGIFFFTCANKWHEERCENTILMLYSVYGGTHAFGGRVRNLKITGGILLYDLKEPRCKSCLEASRPLARLKRFIASLVNRAA